MNNCMCMLWYIKTSNIIISLVSSQKLDWTHTFDTHCKARTVFLIYFTNENFATMYTAIPCEVVVVLKIES